MPRDPLSPAALAQVPERELTKADWKALYDLMLLARGICAHGITSLRSAQ